MTDIVVRHRRTGARLLSAGFLVLALSALAGCGAEDQKPAPAAPSGTIPGGGDSKEYEAKMKEIIGGQKGGAPGAGQAPGEGGSSAPAPK